ncbi:MAG: exonuclease SbcCD subunit D, partial [Pseudomonas sp.]
AVRLVRIGAEYAGNREGDAIDDATFMELGQMTPQELFSRAWTQAYGNAVDEQTLADFALLLQDVQQQEEQP